MKINASKTKEIIVNFRHSSDPEPLFVDNDTIERVSFSKLLGLIISSDLTWSHHVNYIVTKAASLIYSLVLLKRSGLKPLDIIRIFTSMIRPVLEYASPVWHTSLTNKQTKQIESIQKRALKLAFPDLSYSEQWQNVICPPWKLVEKLSQSLFWANEK